MTEADLGRNVVQGRGYVVQEACSYLPWSTSSMEKGTPFSHNRRRSMLQEPFANAFVVGAEASRFWRLRLRGLDDRLEICSTGPS
jgi:hypothetical protein